MITNGEKRIERTYPVDKNISIRIQTISFSLEDKSGSTAIGCLIDPDRVYFLNVGDSRGILVSTDGRILLATKDHKPSKHHNMREYFFCFIYRLTFFFIRSGDQAERQRIQEAGGTVLIQRVNGSLAVSRALGDFEYKNNANRRPDQQLVSPEPEITVYPQHSTTNEQIAFIVLACDGIWDVMSNEELATYILGRMNITDDLCDIANSVLDMCLYKVCFELFRNEKKNFSVFFCYFSGK